MLLNKTTLRKVWKDLGVLLMVGLMFALLFALGTSFLKVYEDSMRVRQRGRLVASIVQEQGNILFQDQSSGAALAAQREQASDPDFLRRWMIERFAATQNDPRVVSRDLQRVIGHSQESPFVLASLKRWQSTLNRWGTEFSSSSYASGDSRDDLKNSHALMLLIEGRQHYFESAGFRRIGKSFDAAVLDLWTISILSKFVEKYPLHPAVPEVLFMLGDEYLSLGSSLPEKAKSDRILNLVPELYPDSIWASRANAVWKSGQVHAI
jgi:hypothetical protein